MKQILLAAICVVAAGCTDSTKPQRTETTVQDRDNTGVNVRDQDKSTKTPIDQNEKKEDVHITADIRKRVVDRKMSVDAHNVKIITQDGKVTLRGPVRSPDEKQQIEEIAVEIAGASNVDNQLEVEGTK